MNFQINILPVAGEKGLLQSGLDQIGQPVSRRAARARATFLASVSYSRVRRAGSLSHTDRRRVRELLCEIGALLSPDGGIDDLRLRWADAGARQSVLVVRVEDRAIWRGVTAKDGIPVPRPAPSMASDARLR